MKAILAYDPTIHLKLKSKDAVIHFDEGLIGSSPESSTGNFQAPLLVNHDKMAGKQIILTDSGFSVRQPLV